jgi:hypothetical protein
MVGTWQRSCYPYYRREVGSPGAGSVAMSRESSVRTMTYSIMAGESQRVMERTFSDAPGAVRATVRA